MAIIRFTLPQKKAPCGGLLDPLGCNLPWLHPLGVGMLSVAAALIADFNRFINIVARCKALA
jgi:hypothetical protein